MKILDVGSGPTPKLVSTYTEIEITYLDRPLDMEKMPYKNQCFDVVVCINALDHTRDAETAVKEMLRVGTVVYINCALDQLTRHRKHHYWDAKEDGRFVNPTGKFDLKDYGFSVGCEDGRMKAYGLSRYTLS